MTVYESLKQAGLLDPKWQLPLGANGGRDNFIKDTAVGVSLELFNNDGKMEWVEAIYKFLDASRVGLGLYAREAGNTSPNSVDNLIGAFVVIDAYKSLCIHGIVAHGLTKNWTYSVPYPEAKFQLCKPSSWRYASDWYGRFIGVPSFIKGRPGLLFALSVWWTCRTPASNTSDKILLWLMYRCLPHTGTVYRFWVKKMTRQYQDVAGLLSIYYGPDHPFTAAAKGRPF